MLACSCANAPVPMHALVLSLERRPGPGQAGDVPLVPHRAASYPADQLRTELHVGRRTRRRRYNYLYSGILDPFARRRHRQAFLHQSRLALSIALARGKAAQINLARDKLAGVVTQRARTTQ